jgi:hypothetical protein
VGSVLTGDIEVIEEIKSWWEAGQITPQEIWETKDEWYEKAKLSREEWDKLSEDQKEATKRIIKACLERLYDTVDEWVPEAMKVQSGEYADIYFRVLFTDIDKDIQRNDAATSFKVKEAKKGTLALLDDLGSLDSDEDEVAA